MNNKKTSGYDEIKGMLNKLRSLNETKYTQKPLICDIAVFSSGFSFISSWSEDNNLTSTSFTTSTLSYCFFSASVLSD